MDFSSLPVFSLDGVRAHALPMLERLGAHFAATPWVGLAVGVALLLLGRRLFWLVVSALGLLVGFALAQRFFPAAQGWVVLAVGLAAGLVAIAVARFVQKLAVAIAAFLVGGYAALWLVIHLGGLARIAAEVGDFAEFAPWIVFLIGGAVGALFGQFFFRKALIVVSSIVGAFLIVQSLPLEPRWTTLALAALTLFGVFFQRRRRQKG